MRPLILERPELQTRAQRYGYASLTLACWFLWLYLFYLPVSQFLLQGIGMFLGWGLYEIAT